MAAKMTDALQADGFNILQNNGEAAGQTVFHFHMHLIPRYKDAEPLFEYNPLSFEAAEMEAILEAIV
jgi:histidine triad (HIT) family protein